jgi:hypothetical protein
MTHFERIRIRNTACRPAQNFQGAGLLGDILPLVMSRLVEAGRIHYSPAAAHSFLQQLAATDLQSQG